MTRWLKNLLGIAIVLLLLWHLAGQWESLKDLVNLNPSTIFSLCISTTLGIVVGAYMIQRLLGAFGIKPGFFEMFHLHNVTLLLNYLPMKFGTLYRANYLKRHYGLLYAHFIVLFVYLMTLMIVAAAGVGFIALMSAYDLAKIETTLLAAIFFAFLLFSLILAFVHLPVLQGTGRWITVLRNFAQGRGMMTGNRRELLIGILLATVCFLTSSVQLGIIYRGLGQEVNPAGFLVLGAIAYVTMFLGVTPGSLGVRELALALGAVALGIDFSVGSLAAIIDRAVALVWSCTIGVASTFYLWRKNPQDFKKKDADTCGEI